jgi:hypothetical protein
MNKCVFPRVYYKKDKNWQLDLKQRDHFCENILMHEILTDFRENTCFCGSMRKTADIARKKCGMFAKI